MLFIYLLNFHSLFEDSFGMFTYIIIQLTNNESLVLSSSDITHLQNFFGYNGHVRATSTMLNNCRLDPNFKGKAFKISLLTMTFP